MFVDTNVLVFASSPGAPNQKEARFALTLHAAAGEVLKISRQCLREFIAVITRPQGWASAKTASEAGVAAAELADGFEVLEDNAAVWAELLILCHRFSFGGRQVHDANIVATMLAYGEHRLLTFNTADFRRFMPLIEIVAP